MGEAVCNRPDFTIWSTLKDPNMCS
jgi:hypothetical protein